VTLRSVLAVLVLAALAAAPSAQQPPSPQRPPVFRTGVNVVTIDVTAVDKDGTPIKGLKADDFVVTLEGQPRPVQAVDFIEYGSGTAAGGGPAAAANSSASSRRERRVVVMLFDDLSVKPGASKGLMVAAERTLAQFGPDDLIGVAVTSGLVKSVNPTTDRAAVHAALSKLVGRAERNPTAPVFLTAGEASEIDRDFPKDAGAAAIARECRILDLGEACPSMVRALARSYASALRNRVANQMDSYKQIIAALAGFQGAKVIVTLSDGVATMSDLSILTRQLEPIMRSAAETGVRFYAMNEDTDAADAGDIDGARARARVLESRDLFDGLYAVAHAAGGEAFHVIGQADRFFTRIEAETSAIYRLAVDAPPGADKARFLNAKVSVKKSGVTVRANRKSLAADAARDVIPIDKQLMNAVASGGVDVAVPITVATVLRRDPQTSQLQINVDGQMPAAIAGPVTTMFSLVDEAGTSVKAGRLVLPPPAGGSDYRFSFPLPVAPGRYSVRVSAADANGRVGSTEQRVEARLSRIGGFSASSLLVGWAGADGVQKLLALDTLPTDAVTLHASVELYADDQAGMATDIAMKFSILEVGDQKASIEKDVRPSTTGLTLFGVWGFDAAALGPGTYTIKATVLQSGVEKGAVSALVRKR
jgi:VWFA-related protein